MGFVWDTHSAPDWGTRGDCSRCVVVMRMASASWFYLFNIQVRANCTTACNRQAALQYVKLTHESTSESLFFNLDFGCTKMCMQLWTGSKVMLAPGPFNAVGSGRGLGPKRRMDIGVCVPTGQSDWLLSHSQRCTSWAIHLFFRLHFTLQHSNNNTEKDW